MQVEERQRRIEEERRDAAAYGARLCADAESLRQQAKAKKAAQRVQKAEHLQHLKELYMLEQKQRCGVVFFFSLLMLLFCDL